MRNFAPGSTNQLNSLSSTYESSQATRPTKENEILAFLKQYTPRPKHSTLENDFYDFGEKSVGPHSCRCLGKCPRPSLGLEKMASI